MNIDAEFSKLIPALTDGEYKALETSILAEGCRDALVVWNDILIDGHNRYKICQKHNVVFSLKDIEFQSREDAKIWIINNQLARRNLTLFVYIELARQLESLIRVKGKENQQLAGALYGENHPKQELCQNSDKALEPIDTKKEMAKIAHTSHDTYVKASKIIELATEEVKDKKD